MSKGKRHFKGNNRTEDKKRRRDNEDNWKSSTERVTSKLVNFNEKFDAFYRCQGIANSDKDWEDFSQCLKTPLPACFRVNPNYALSDDLKKQLHKFVGETLVIDGKY